MLQHKIILLIANMVSIPNALTSYGKTIEVSFEADLVWTRYLRGVPKVTGSFQYDDEAIYSGNGLFHEIEYVEIKDFTISYQGYDTNFGDGVFYTASPRFPDVEQFNFNPRYFAIGEVDYVHADSPFIQKEQEEEIYSFVGLDPDGEISAADYNALDEEQQFLATFFWPTGMPRVVNPTIKVALGAASLSVSDVVQSNFQDDYLSSWQFYADIPCNSGGPILYPGDMNSSNTTRALEYCEVVMMEYDINETFASLIVPEPTALVQSLVFLLLSYGLVDFRIGSQSH